MKENRIVYICDYCGRAELERYGWIGDVIVKKLPVDWEGLGKEHLCPVCAETYRRFKAEVKAEKAKKENEHA